MKLIKHFDDFLKKVVNLNQSRLDILKDRVIAIEKYLKNNDMFGNAFVDLKSQGSWAHRTIIKPSEKRPEFDADVLFYMHEFENWEPKEYVEKLYQEFRKNGLYKDKVHRSTRCVVVDYKGEFHIDIVPTFVRNEGFFIEDSHTYITNRIDNILEETNPEGYIDWFNKKNKQTNGNLNKVIRLAKYLRDIKQTFSVKSILLTTLLSDQVKTGSGDADDPDVDYPDVPTGLKTIFNRLNEFLQVNEEIPHIHNPSLPDENFIRHWDKPKYTNFRNKIS